MRVKATRKGYYEHKLRDEGAEFDLKSRKDFSAAWMEDAAKSVDAGGVVEQPKITKQKSQPVSNQEVI